MGDPKEATRQVFVAYAYNVYDRRDYRAVYTGLEKAYGVKFIFADEKITNMHILQKIISYIRSSDFSLFDISGWNPNVTLELGVALAMSGDWYICFNPNKTPLDDVPSDIKGIDRVQYGSFTELSEKLAAVLEQRYPKVAQRQPLDEYLGTLKKDILALVRKQPGLRMEEIADIMQVNVKMAQMILIPLVGSTLRTEGQRRGARYYITE